MQNQKCQKSVIVPAEPVRLVRRLIQKFAPVRNARVRYDSERSSWALLNEDNRPIRHFTHGFMQDVSFTSVETVSHVGCGGPQTTHIGLATGTLREGIYSPNLSGLKNLSFHSGYFIDATGLPVGACSSLQLMPGRHALYQV